MPDHEETVRELKRRFPAWMIWHGNATGTWWAYGPTRRLIEAETPEGLADRIDPAGARTRAVQPPAGQAVLGLDGDPVPVRTARQAVRDAVRAWGLDHLLDDAELVVSELVTNAVAHAGPPIVLRLARAGAVLTIEVSDGSPEPPREADHGGFGGLVVTSLAEIDVRLRNDGKTVRATLPRRDG
jgi:hypothetical protein